LFNEIFSHPDTLYSTHIDNMIAEQDSTLVQAIKKYHDIGKLTDNFQKYIRGENIKDKNHSEISAYIFLKVNSDIFTKKELLFAYVSIIRHHGYILDMDVYIDNIKDYIEDKDKLTQIINNSAKILMYQNIDTFNTELEMIIKKISNEFKVKMFEKKSPFSIVDYVQFRGLFSNLVYSDKHEAIFKTKNLSKLMICNLDKYYLEYTNKFDKEKNINNQREMYSDRVTENYKQNQDKSIFKMVGGTGIGKTLTSLRVAIEMKPKKIIYVLPFTNIIEQTYSLFHTIYKESEIQIIQNHYMNNPYIIDNDENENIDKDKKNSSSNKFTTVNFGGDINITTTYQLFYGLFGNNNSDFVKFEQFKDAVIVIDEIQSIDENLKNPFLEICEKLSQEYNTKFIFMSATMPIININHCDISDYEHFRLFNRYKLEFKLDIKEEMDYIDKCIELSQSNSSVLCVVNQITTAKNLYLKLENKVEGLFILHGELTVYDKQSIIDKIRKKILMHEKVILMSTQSIEAGVDLDFEVGIREFAPFSSIVQTAGRVNRNNKSSQSSLYIFGEISKYSQLIYGALLLKTKQVLKTMKQDFINENKISEFNERYFEILDTTNSGINFKLYYKRLEFEKISKIMDKYFSNNYKIMIYVEPSEDYFINFKEQYNDILNEDINHFDKKDRISNLMFQIIKYSVSITTKTIESVEINNLLYDDSIKYVKFNGINQYKSEFGFNYKQEVFL